MATHEPTLKDFKLYLASVTFGNAEVMSAFCTLTEILERHLESQTAAQPETITEAMASPRITAPWTGWSVATGTTPTPESESTPVCMHEALYPYDRIPGARELCPTCREPMVLKWIPQTPAPERT